MLVFPSIASSITLHNEKLGGKRIQVLGVLTMSEDILVLSHVCAAILSTFVLLFTGLAPSSNNRWK